MAETTWQRRKPVQFGLPFLSAAAFLTVLDFLPSVLVPLLVRPYPLQCFALSGYCFVRAADPLSAVFIYFCGLVALLCFVTFRESLCLVCFIY